MVGVAAAIGTTPSHTYSAIGAYNVTLTVTDNESATARDRSPAAIDLINKPPLPDADGLYPGVVDVPLTFDGSGECRLTAFLII